MGNRLRESIATIVCLMLATTVCFWPLVQHPTDLLVGPQRGGLTDLLWYFVPAHDASHATHAPFVNAAWDPSVGFGSPSYANPQAGNYYPPNWIVRFAGAAASISWGLVAHHLFAGLGVFALCRRHRFTWLASLVGGVAFLAAPFLVAQTAEGHYAQTCVIAWVPWAFVAYGRWRSRERGGLAALAAVLALGFFAGHPQEVLYLALALSAWCVTDAVIDWRQRAASAALRTIARWIVVAAAVAGLSAVSLLPMRAFLRLSVRSGGIDASEAGDIAIGTANLRQLVDPFALGGPDSYHGPGDYFWETLCHFGRVPFVLAVVAAIAARRRPPVARFAGLFVVSLSFAFGTASPVFRLLHSAVPGIALFRVPSRALYFCSLAVAVLAAAAVDWFCRRDEDAGRALVSLQPHAAPTSLGLVTRPTWRQVVACGLFVLCVIELSVTARGLIATVPASSLRTKSPVAHFLRENAGHARVVATQELLSDGEASRHGIHQLEHYDPAALASVAAVVAAMRTDARPVFDVLFGFMPIGPDELRPNLLRLAGVRFAVMPSRRAIRSDGWNLVSRGTVPPVASLRGAKPQEASYSIYENLDALPRAFVIGRAREITKNDRLDELLAALDPRSEVLLPRDVLPPEERQEFKPAEIVEYAPTRVIIEATLEAPGYLVLTDAWYPGWKAADRGQPTSVIPANVAFRAVPLAAGEHRVEFWFEPPGLKLGGAISCLTALLLACSVFATFDRARAAA